MLASQVLDSQDTPSGKYFRSTTPVVGPPYVPPTPKVPKTLLSPLPLPTPGKRRRTGTAASDSDHDPALTESEVSPTKVRVVESDEEEVVRESPRPSQNPYASVLPIPYRTGRDLGPGGPRRKLNFDSNDSELLNHDL
jgi:hypothetical protein